MDLDIAGKHALVCAASKGLGYGCADALAAEGVNLTITARGKDALEDAARRLRDAHGVTVTIVPADMGTPEGRKIVLAACPDPDILINNAGGPPAGDFRKFGREDWLRALDLNMLGAIELITATVDKMVERRFGRIVNITSGAMRVPIGTLPLSNGARGGLTAFISGAAGMFAAANVTLNNILPGAFETDRLASLFRDQAQMSGKTEAETRAQRLGATPAKRAGTPAEFGALCAFLCSRQAGYITGQNMLIDGGASPTTF